MADREISTRDMAVHVIAAQLDRPSVYMGGPSKRSLRVAEKAVTALETRGMQIVECQEARDA